MEKEKEFKTDKKSEVVVRYKGNDGVLYQMILKENLNLGSINNPMINLKEIIVRPKYEQKWFKGK